jgi:nicotinamidase-related amidase
MELPSNAALLVIDVQYAIDAPYHAAEGPRNNRDAEAKIAAMLTAFRGSGRPVLHIRHDSVLATSSYRPGQPGNDFKAEVAPLPGETVIAKRTNSAFIGTKLEEMLRADGISVLIVAGVATNNSVEATVRMAGNLGFDVRLVEDACFTFAKRDYDGRLRNAGEVHAMALANMNEEYCAITSSAAVIAAC